MAPQPEENKLKVERKQDVWSLMLTILNALGWLILLVAIIVIARAAPQLRTWYDDAYNTNVRTFWDRDLIAYINMLMAAVVCISVAGLAIATQRYRRRTDLPRIISLMFLGVFGLGAIFFFLLRVTT